MRDDPGHLRRLFLLFPFIAGCDPTATAVPFVYPTNPEYLHCTSKQRAVSDGAYLTATRKVYDAVVYYETAPDPEWKKHRYWFDTTNTSFFREVAKENFKKIWDLFHQPVTIICDADAAWEMAPEYFAADNLPCDDNAPINRERKHAVPAFVTPEHPNLIWYCPRLFFSDSFQDLDLFGRPAMLVHEQSHQIAPPTVDVPTESAYIEGHERARDPNQATRTAANYQYFAMDTLAGVSLGCRLSDRRDGGTSIPWLLAVAWIAFPRSRSPRRSNP